MAMDSMESEMKINKVSEFIMSNENIETFNRVTKNDFDCVPNALYLLGAIDSKTTDIMRILARRFGVYVEEIEDIFNYLLGKEFKFLVIDKRFLYNYCENNLKPGHAVFCGYKKQQLSHVFLLAKRLDGVLVLLDGQNRDILCIITGENSECWRNYIADVYFILTTLEYIPK